MYYKNRFICTISNGVEIATQVMFICVHFISFKMCVHPYSGFYSFLEAVYRKYSKKGGYKI